MANTRRRNRRNKSESNIKSNILNKKNKKLKTRRRKIKSSLKCAPKSSSNDFSCYSNSHLFELKKAWNKSKHPKIRTNNPKEIWNFLKEQYKNKCSKESCWVKQANIPNKYKQKILKNSFAPKSPDEWKKNPNTWLSSVDIINVMEQYERGYPEFRFIGPSPIDFDKKLAFNQCVWNDLCNIDVGQLIQNKKSKVGMIFNLDPHYKDGSLWVAMYLNIKKGDIYYFDSVGDKIPKQIKTLKESIIDQCSHLNIKTNFDELYPKTEHQMRNTECGMYCLYFIIMMLTEKKRWKDFKCPKKRITDEEMTKFRKIFFNKEI